MNEAVFVEERLSKGKRRFFHLVVDNDNILADPTRKLVKSKLRSPTVLDLRDTVGPTDTIVDVDTILQP